MKKKLSVIALSVSILSLTACGETQEKENQKNVVKISQNIPTTTIPKETPKTEEKSLNSLTLIFKGLMDSYLENGEKNLKGLENMHLSFVPILNFEKFKGDEAYKKAALSLGQIVHDLEDVEGEDYQNLLNTLKPAYIKFYSEYGE